MPESKHAATGGLGMPLDIEALESLPVGAGGVTQFDFVYRHIRFAVRYENADGHLKVVGDAGPIPFSAEAPAARSGLVHIMFAANDVLGPRFRLVDGHILVGSEVTIEHPMTASKLIGAVASFLIPVLPYLDLVAVFIRPPLAPANPGEPALRPEWKKKAR